MAEELARARLARQAIALNRAAGVPLPPLVFLTDDARVRDPLAAIAALPRGSLAILRSRTPQRRAALANAVAPLARSKGLVWLIADDPDLATRTGSHGAHFPEARLAAAHQWRARRPRWLITCAAHSLVACRKAWRAGADAVLFGPVFATQSHAGRGGLGPLFTRIVASQSPVPLFALGGIDASTARRLSGARLAGLAAIGALTV